MSNLRIELTDQPGGVVGGLVERYAALARGDGDADDALEWLQANLVDSTGHGPGVTEARSSPSPSAHGSHKDDGGRGARPARRRRRRPGAGEDGAEAQGKK